LRSLSKAAEASHIGVAAASRRIALLEHRFKTPLLDRSPRGVELTAAGVSLLAHAKALLVQLNDMNAEMTDHAAGRKGVLRLLANTSAMTETLPEDLASFGQANPDIRLVIQERWSGDILRSLLAGEADIGIIIDGARTEGLEVFPYRNDRLAVIAPIDHPLARDSNWSFSDVLEYDLVALEVGSSMMRLLTEQAIVLEKALRLRIQVRSFEAVCRMVQVGMGVGILPYEAAKVLAESMKLSVRPMNEPWAQRQVLVCVKKDRPAKPSLTLLINHLTA